MILSIRHAVHQQMCFVVKSSVQIGLHLILFLSPAYLSTAFLSVALSLAAFTHSAEVFFWTSANNTAFAAGKPNPPQLPIAMRIMSCKPPAGLLHLDHESSLPSVPLAAIPFAALPQLPSQFSASNAFWLAWASVLAYDGYAAIPNIRALGFDAVRTFDNPRTGLQAYVAANADLVMVSFAGTGEPLDVLMDLRLAQRPDSASGTSGRMHEGFLAALDPNWNAIRQTILGFQNRSQRIYITGHSMGSALATLTAIRLSNEMIPVAGVYLFAPPRVGDGTFAAHYNERLGDKTFLVINDEDVIARLPPSPVASQEFSSLAPKYLRSWLTKRINGQDYTHVGIKYRIGSNGKLMPEATVGEEDDKPYWNVLRERSNGQNIVNLAITNYKLILNHMPPSSFCTLEGPRALQLLTGSVY